MMGDIYFWSKAIQDWKKSLHGPYDREIYETVKRNNPGTCWAFVKTDTVCQQNAEK